RYVLPLGAHFQYSSAGPSGKHFQASITDELLHERVPDLDGAALLFGSGLRQVLRRERRAGQTVAAGGRPDIEDRVADAFGCAADDLFVAQDAEAERIDEGVTFVTLVEVNFARERRDAEAVSVMGDAADDPCEQTTIAGYLRRSTWISRIAVVRVFGDGPEA